MPLELTVLGSNPAWSSPSGACSGYLLQTDTHKVLLDCGTGVFERLRSRIEPERLSTIVLSHLHFDHWLDVIPLRYYLNYEARTEQLIDLYLPEGGSNVLHAVTREVDPNPEFFTSTFNLHEYDAHDTLRLGDLTVTMRQTRHPIDTFAMRFETDGRVLAYTADTGWMPELASFLQGAHLLLSEAAWGSTEGGDPSIHLSAAQAGQLAASAAVERLLLTHLPGTDADESTEHARRLFPGGIAYATEGLHVRI